MALGRLAPSAALIAMASSKLGKAKKISVTLIRTVSTTPRLNPAIAPTSMPKGPARPITAAAIDIEMRAPYKTREKMSRPTASVPNRWLRDGDCNRSAMLVLKGDEGARKGAPTAATRRTNTKALLSTTEGLPTHRANAGEMAGSARDREYLASLITRRTRSRQPKGARYPSCRDPWI